MDHNFFSPFFSLLPKQPFNSQVSTFSLTSINSIFQSLKLLHFYTFLILAINPITFFFFLFFNIKNQNLIYNNLISFFCTISFNVVRLGIEFFI